VTARKDFSKDGHVCQTRVFPKIHFFSIHSFDARLSLGDLVPKQPTTHLGHIPKGLPSSVMSVVKKEEDLLIPETYFDAPTQRLYALSLGLLCQVNMNTSGKPTAY